MNYLAHMFLAGDTAEERTGALLGDFVKGSIEDRFPEAIRNGILLHRAIDRYTDAHPTVRASCMLVSDERRRFAGILVDVFYDHFLARHWRRYSAMPLNQFTQSVYAALGRDRGSHPPRLQQILPCMMRDDWLGSYGDLNAVDAALNGIARRFRRFRRAVALTNAIVELDRNYDAFEVHFLRFFPQLIRYAQAYRRFGAQGTLALQRTGT